MRGHGHNIYPAMINAAHNHNLEPRHSAGVNNLQIIILLCDVRVLKFIFNLVSYIFIRSHPARCCKPALNDGLCDFQHL